jgi:hypothetical protein
VNRSLLLGTALSAVLALALLARPSPSLAALDIDLGARLRVGDDTEIFVAVSSRYFDRDQADVQRWQRSCGGSADDLAVILFLSRQSGQPPARIMAFRAEGLTWWQIGVRLGVPPEVWFVDLKGNPGPPYGKAYGHWRKHRGDRSHVFQLADSEVRDLVAVRILHEYYGVEVSMAMEWRAAERDLGKLTAKEYRKRHQGKGPAAAGMTERRPLPKPEAGDSGPGPKTKGSGKRR